MAGQNFVLGKNTPNPNESVEDLISVFMSEIETMESMKKVPFILFQDGKSRAYYIECHIQASIGMPLIDNDAVLDPDEQEQFRLQRELQPNNPAFLRMCSDAIENRQFSDIISEYDNSYRPETPLKILGGQHRIEAIKKALENDSVSRYHGFKIFFGLSIDQRNEIAQIANTNIAISTDLIDRMQETVRGPQLRNFCHQIDLLPQIEDFADRKNLEGRITVRLARTFVVNFLEGRKIKNKDFQGKAYMPYACKSGQDDPKYSSWVQNKAIWNDAALLAAGKHFADLHKKQMAAASRDKELNKGEYKNKAISMAVLSSWALVAGLLQNNVTALEKLYALPKKAGDKDPLGVKAMAESRHPKDPPILSRIRISLYARR